MNMTMHKIIHVFLLADMTNMTVLIANRIRMQCCGDKFDKREKNH
jgi:hypothetical protein